VRGGQRFPIELLAGDRDPDLKTGIVPEGKVSACGSTREHMAGENDAQ
jgi:hypothetical protein